MHKNITYPNTHRNREVFYWGISYRAGVRVSRQAGMAAAHTQRQISAAGCTATFLVRGLMPLLPQCLQPPYALLLLLYRGPAPRESLHSFRKDRLHRAFGILIAVRKWNFVPLVSNRRYQLGRRRLLVNRGDARGHFFRRQGVGPPELQQRPCGSQPPPSANEKGSRSGVTRIYNWRSY